MWTYSVQVRVKTIFSIISLHDGGMSEAYKEMEKRVYRHVFDAWWRIIVAASQENIEAETTIVVIVT